MTIILSCLTPEYIVQVSDRRISIPQLIFRDGSLVREYFPRDDYTNKAIWWNRIVALSYTGLGIIAGMPTDLWITKTLANFSTFQEGLEGLRGEATEYFRKYEPYHYQQGLLAIVGIGWSPRSSELHGSPFLFLISNFHDNLHTPLYRRGEFKIWFGSFNSGHELILYVTGQPLLRYEYINLKRYIQEALKRNLSPDLVTKLLANTIRHVAERNNTVGKNLMVVSLPKKELSHSNLSEDQELTFFLHAPPSRQYASFYYLSERDETVEYGPNIVQPGSFAADYRHEFVGDEERVSIRPGFANDEFVETRNEINKADADKTKSGSPYDYYDVIVLTPWAGSGTFKDPRRPAIADEYKIEGHGAIANVPSWPRNQPCPYYGYIVGLTIASDIISEIGKDSRFFIICNPDTQDEIPDQEWLLGIRTWIVSQGMLENSADTLMQHISALTRKQIIEELNSILSIPKDSQKV